MYQLLEVINASSKRWCYQIFNFPQITQRHKSYIRWSASNYGKIFDKIIWDVNILESKLLEYQGASDSKLPSCFDEYGKPIEIKLIWHQIYQLTGAHSNQPQFKNLPQLATFLPLIPQSNSCCENVLVPSGRSSQIKTLVKMLSNITLQLVFTKKQHQLGNIY